MEMIFIYSQFALYGVELNDFNNRKGIDILYFSLEVYDNIAKIK